jgi:transcriptional regulator with XRE-family HTH domain
MNETLKKILEKMKKKKISQAELARRIGISHAMVNRWFLGKASPRLKNYEKILKAIKK